LLLDRATSSGEKRMVANALRQISGIELPAVASAWQRWFEAEQRWLAEEGPAAVEHLASEDDLVVAKAVVELSARTLYKERIAAELRPLLARHPSPAIRARVCLALGRFGGTATVEALQDALRDRDAGVRWAARRALEALGHAEVSPPIDARGDSTPIE
jgi:HEAT repeat protein